MSNYKVDITGINTSNLKVLKHEEMVELFKEYQNGNEKAKEKLVMGNLKLVLSILKRFNNQKYNLDDLFQMGCIGLTKAVKNFDLSHEVRFSTYAVPLIKGEIKRYVRDNSPLRVSRSIKDLAYKILEYKDNYLATNGIYPSNSEIASFFNIEEYEISSALDSLKEPLSIFEPTYNDGGDPIFLVDQIMDKKDKEYDKDLILSLRKALEKIKMREKQVLLERFIIGKTQTEIADELNISQAQVSRIEKNAIKNVKRLIK